jgi:hypothetical protein
MKKLYVVRGIGKFIDDAVRASEDPEVTMLEKRSGRRGRWSTALYSAAYLCYYDFNWLTGIELAPGEYTMIKVGEIAP